MYENIFIVSIVIFIHIVIYYILYRVTHETLYDHTYFAISGKVNTYGGGGNDFSCSGKADRRYTNTDSCSKFWNCYNGHRLNN